MAGRAFVCHAEEKSTTDGDAADGRGQELAPADDRAYERDRTQEAANNRQGILRASAQHRAHKAACRFARRRADDSQRVGLTAIEPDAASQPDAFAVVP